MGGRGGSSSGSHGGAVAPVATRSAQGRVTPARSTNAPVGAAAAPVAGPPTGTSFPDLNASQQQAILAAQRPKQNQTSLYAIHEYTRATPQSNGYSLSQNTNWALETGRPLTQRQAAMKNGLQSLMGPIGHETTLYRADHDDILKRLGVNYQTMTTSQLKQALVGRSWQTKGFTSTSHDKSKNPFWPGNYAGGGREIVMRIHTSKSAKVALVQRSQAEVVLDIGTNFRITGVRDTGTWARPRVGGRKKVIEIDVDVW